MKVHHQIVKRESKRVSKKQKKSKEGVTRREEEEKMHRPESNDPDERKEANKKSDQIQPKGPTGYIDAPPTQCNPKNAYQKNAKRTPKNQSCRVVENRKKKPKSKNITLPLLKSCYTPTPPTSTYRSPNSSSSSASPPHNSPAPHPSSPPH